MWILTFNGDLYFEITTIPNVVDKGKKVSNARK